MLHGTSVHPFDFAGSSNLIFVAAEPNAKRADIIKLGKDEKIRDRFSLHANNPNANLPFTVILDGVELSRPVELPLKLRRVSRLKNPMFYVDKVESAFDKKQLVRAGGQLSFEAYLYWNSKIIPKETSGALIRVREASGTLFDQSFLNYQVSEQNRLSQITAEIFVHQGLDGAINIDRESFNYSHPHYLFIQKWLHRSLRLFISRNKALAKEDLDAEKNKQKDKKNKVTLERATSIWNSERGDDSDPPILELENELASDVGGTPIAWPDETHFKDETKASAVAIVLEAYGVLSHLSSSNRAALIRDILKVLDEHA